MNLIYFSMFLNLNKCMSQATLGSWKIISFIFTDFGSTFCNGPTLDTDLFIYFNHIMNGKQNGLLTYIPIGSPSMFYKIQGNGLGFIFANIIGIGEYMHWIGFYRDKWSWSIHALGVNWWGLKGLFI